jgi:alginate O-acetyltransferase complex protein AlgI
VVFGWVAFRSDNLTFAGHMVRAMVVPSGLHLDAVTSASLTHRVALVFVLSLLVFAIPANFVTGRFLEFGATRKAAVARLWYVVAAAPVAAALVAVGTFSPFLYYQF